MKIFFFIAFLMIQGIGLNSKIYAESQMALNEAACKEYTSVDKEMNQIYQQVLSQYQNDKTFIKAFINAQRQWLHFRDAHLASVYPKTNKDAYGSIYRLCYCNTLTTITTARLNQIKEWVIGVKEGDVCGGSIRVRNQ